MTISYCHIYIVEDWFYVLIIVIIKRNELIAAWPSRILCLHSNSSPKDHNIYLFILLIYHLKAQYLLIYHQKITIYTYLYYLFITYRSQYLLIRKYFWCRITYRAYQVEDEVKGLLAPYSRSCLEELIFPESDDLWPERNNQSLTSCLWGGDRSRGGSRDDGARGGPSC